MEKTKTLTTDSLAFTGDAVYSLLVRERLSVCLSASSDKLHKKSIEFVSASAQAKGYESVKDMLTDDETAVFKRGRNSNISAPRTASSPAEYRIATGLETLFGYLHLNGEKERLNELFSCIYNHLNG